jgi:hypothetical protein
MRYQYTFSVLLGLLATICRADLMQYADELPPCGVSVLPTMLRPWANANQAELHPGAATKLGL